MPAHASRDKPGIGRSIWLLQIEADGWDGPLAFFTREAAEQELLAHVRTDRDLWAPEYRDKISDI